MIADRFLYRSFVFSFLFICREPFLPTPGAINGFIWMDTAAFFWTGCS